MPLTRSLCLLAFSLLPLAACGPGTVEIRATQTCEGGNVSDCKNRCQNNEGMACYKLGWLHEEGQVVDHDFPQAKKLYEQACDAKWAVACRALGDLYWRGEKVDANRKKAIDYWQRACELGLSVACPSQLEQDVAEGRLIVKVKSNGTVQVTPNPKADRPAAPLPNQAPDAGSDVRLPPGAAPTPPSAPAAPKF